MEHFPIFGKAVSNRFDAMSKNELFVVDVEDIFATYLAAFPEGTNPIFRERTEHDCNCCKQFVRRLGIVVSINEDGSVQTVWDDYEQMPEPYNIVGERLASVVRQAPIKGIFRTKEHAYSTPQNRDNTDFGIVWHHFHGKVAGRHHTPNPAEVIGKTNTKGQVFERGLREITPYALDTAIDLIESKTLYRGEEFLARAKEFRTLQKDFNESSNQTTFVWTRLGHPAATIRNSAFGTLLIDLSAGMDLELAVRRYEKVMAPANYKRPKAIVTEKMIDAALADIRELGLEESIERRFANVRDLSVNDVLFVDRSVSSKMKDGLKELLIPAAQSKPKDSAKGEAILITDFIADVLPKAQSISLYVENRHLPNFVSITAPVHEGSPNIFKWDNPFAWVYDGDVADSQIKQRVAKAGGNVNAKLRVSLSWFNSDDLDIHAITPTGHISYQRKEGVLDVDMNAFSISRDPVENLSWNTLAAGEYRVYVNQYNRRSNENYGFDIEVEYNGQVFNYEYRDRVDGNVDVLNFTIQNGEVVEFSSPLGDSAAISNQKWNVSTGQYVKVDTIMLSPNFWDGEQVGNQHYFFILDGCKNPDAARGFFNEQLSDRLHEHRRVFELLGSKTKCEPTNEQLSGLGFSSTISNAVKALVQTQQGQKIYEILF